MVIIIKVFLLYFFARVFMYLGSKYYDENEPF